MKQGIGVIVFLFIVCSLTSFSYAVPTEINYQGYLTDQNGVPIDGITNITFRLYDVDTGGSSLWDSGAVAVDVANGVYSVVLGDTSAASTQPAIDPSIFANQLWLGIVVETDGEMTPRQKLTAVSYSITAATVEDGAITDAKITGPISAAKIEQGTGSTLDADLLDGQDGSYYTDWFSLTNVPADIADGDNDTTYTAGTGLYLTDTTFNVEVPLTLDGAPAGGATLRVYNSSNNAGSIGLYGLSTATSGATYGAVGYNASTSGAGVYGVAQATTGPAKGVYGRSASESGYGVYGVAMSPSGTNYGVYGQSTSVNGYGLYGYASALSGGTAGAYGLSSSDFGVGVFGLANAPTGQTRGVHGKSESASGYGVYGQATGGGTGGFFTSDSGYGLIVANGSVGIGTTTPSEKLTVAGTIESTSGGVKFPDGSVQTSAIYGKVAVVAQTGGQYTSPLDAMNDIASWCGVPGKTNPCLVKIMPGIYDLGNNGLFMHSWVDIEGSGERTTTITSTHSSSSADETSATIVGSSSAEIRFITIENRGDGYCIAMFNAGGSPNITHVTAVVSGVYSNYGVYNLGASPTMKDVNIFFSQAGFNYGVYNYASALSYSSPTMIDITITDLGVSGINYGVYNAYANPTMRGISINLYYGTHDYGVYNFYANPTMTDMIITASGVVENYGIANYTSSPTMTDVTVTVSGGAESYGVYNYQISLPIMTDVKITASGDNGNDITCGMCNYGGSNLEMTDVKITASGDPESLTWGVNNEFSSPTMTDVSITASGGLLTFGIANNPSNLIIKNSSISSTSQSIYNSSSYSSTVKVGATMLEGAVYGTGFTCVGAYDENFVALGTNCL